MSLLPDAMLARLCARQAELIVIFALSCLGLVITVFTLLFIDLDGGTRAVAFLNVPGLVAMIAWTGYVLYLCRDDLPSGRGA